MKKSLFIKAKFVSAFCRRAADSVVDNLNDSSGVCQNLPYLPELKY